MTKDNVQVKLVQIQGKLYFGKYQLLQTLGEGEFGKVKLAVLEDGSQYAIKFVKKSILSSENRSLKLQREIDILKQISHENIIKLHLVMESEKYIGLVMEYASGGELFDYILAKRHLTEKEAKRFFYQLISSVSYLHDNKIIHRDLKLENLLLDMHANLKITDFGFANHATDLMSTSCGSPCYAAPELVLSDSYVGTAADIWSCGVILYAMLCGYLPFDDDPLNPDSSNVNLLYKYILNTPLKFPTWVSHSARDLLRKLLAPDPAERYTMDQLMHHPWMVSGLPTKQNPLSQHVDMPKPFIRGRASSAPAPLDENLVISIPPVVNSQQQQSGAKKSDKVTSPLISTFRHRFGSTRFVPSPSFAVIEEAISPPVTSPQSSSPNQESPLPSLTPSTSSTNNLIFSPKDRSVSNPDSVASMEDYSTVNTLKDLNGALDPKTVSSSLMPVEMIDRCVQVLLTQQLDEFRASFNDGVITVNRKSFSLVSCVWTRADLPKPLDFETCQLPQNVVATKRRGSVGAQVVKSIIKSFNKFSIGNSTREVKFTIQACKVPNLSGLYCLDIHRVRGDKWQFKKLYEELISRIDFQ